MVRSLVHLLVLVLALLMFAACTTVPLTGRRQLNLVPKGQLHSMADDQYTSFLKQNTLSSDVTARQMVQEVGRDLQYAVEDYYRRKDLSDQLSGYDWEFNLIESEEKNAWCMPGGKVVVYEGILPLTQDRTGLAVVMGHEIAHAVARHGNERMSAGMLAQFGAAALNTAMKEKPEATRRLFLGAYGVGAQVGVLLPYSRQHETEADYLGLIFMARAGYDPRAAVPFWQRMASKGGASPPEFLSTHPTSQTRIENIKKAMPMALKHYRQEVSAAR